MNPHYYIMKSKKILRLEEDMNFSDLPLDIQNQLIDCDAHSLNQEQANWRVVIFRDEILELSEYLEWMNSDEAQLYQEEYELDLVAN